MKISFTHSVHRDQKEIGKAGFSLFEVLAVVAVIGALGAATLGYTSRISRGSDSAKLVHQVKQLNSAVKMYFASGGQIEPGDTVAIVLEKLKTAAGGDYRLSIGAHRGKFVDPRLSPVYQSSSEMSSSEQRAHWDSSKKRFVVSNSGANGIKCFQLTEAAIPASVNTDYQQRDIALKVSATSGWVWDYANFSNGIAGSPEDFEGVDLPTPPAAGGGIAVMPDPLLPPDFSIPGGDYHFYDFLLELTLDNPNDEAVSSIIYRAGDADWEDYEDGEVILVAPNDSVEAMVISKYPSLYYDSSSKKEVYVSTFTITGDTLGSFADATGGPDLVTGGEDNLFEWGSPYVFGGFADPSWLLFNGAAFYDVNPDERFEIGSLTYYNGTILSGTGADSVDLDIELAFGGGGGETRDFNFTLDLVNVVNDEHAHSGTDLAWASADYVYLNDLASSVTQTLGGVEYELILEFGETSSEGFSTIDSFYVLEEGLATGTLYGTLVQVDMDL